ncbi:MAG: hypothetical protein IJY09_08695, partial [Lachnospiraceae bacterium]|nr:hypothetical protein [Lachnospiraceae bacterium]
MKKKLLGSIILTLALCVTGCASKEASQSDVSPTNSPKSTEVPEPTGAVEPTPTEVAEPTAEPTGAAEPTPTEV